MTGFDKSISSDISLSEIISKFKIWVDFLLKKWKFILFFGFLGTGLGIIYAINTPPTYTAKLTFILEESKSSSSGLGNLASLAGQFGVDVSNGAAGNILSNDNLLVYFKSPGLAREVLLSRLDSITNQTIADIYAEEYGFKRTWQESQKIGVVNFFAYDNNKRLNDSLLQIISEDIIKDKFIVSRPDKKATFLDVAVSMQNEVLSKIYCERIVQLVVDRYISVKTKRQHSTVNKLQKRADSIYSLLQEKTLSNASIQNSSNTMDINPLYRTKTNVAVETSFRDKALLSTIFSSVIQNLEVAKFTLNQDTPIIQIIDEPILPLKKNKTSVPLTAVLFFITFSLISCAFLIAYRFLNKQIKYYY